jgi:NAD(P)-dependent dehydrogenase (short-subunit alcohol dehydrogenase family)
MVRSKTLNESLLDRYGLGGKLACVLGMTGQIGTALTKAFVQVGADVVGTSRHDDRILEVMEMCNELVGAGCGRVIGGITCDLTSPETIDSTITEELRVAVDGRPIDILILNAGGTGGTEGLIGSASPFESYPLDSWQRLFELNFMGPVRFAQACFPLLRAASDPTVGVVLSMSYEGSLSKVLPYRIFKRALEEWTRSMAAYVSKHEGPQWQVFGVRPGFILAEQNRAVLSPNRLSAILDQMPRGEFQSAEEVADAIVSLCSPASTACHGAIIDIAAGYTTMGLGRKADE